MDKKCLIIMPTSDPEGYAKGHFNRVYQYIIVPACKAAGFRPVKADDPASSETALDIVKTLIDTDVAICDVSSKNSHAVYGLAIRQSMGLPSVLLKDAKTKTIFDVQEFSGIEYDESLRIDTVESEIELLSNAINKAFANKATNPLMTKLGIGIVPVMVPQSTSNGDAREEEDDTKEKEIHLPVISPLPDYVGDPISEHEQIDKLKVGDFIFHMNYGKGEIKSIKKAARDKIAGILFGTESKFLVLVTTGVFRKLKA